MPPADFRLAAEGTKFAFPFTRRGIVPEARRRGGCRVAPLSVALTRQLVYRMAWAASPEPVHRADSRLVYETGRGPDAVQGGRVVL